MKCLQNGNEGNIYANYSWHYFEVCSPNLIKELQKRIPEDFDRSDHLTNFTNKSFTNAFTNQKRGDDVKDRIYSISKALGVSFFTNNIPTISDVITRRLDSIKRDEYVDFLTQMRFLTLHIMSQLLFGKEFFERISYARYRNPDKYVSHKHFFDVYPQISKDLEDEQFNWKSHYFPFLAQNSVIDPHKRNSYNICELWRIITEHVNISKDSGSLISILSGNNETSKMQWIHDLQALLQQAYDTIPHALCSILYLIKKNEEYYDKIKKDLKHLEYKFEKPDGNYLKSEIDDCDNLTCVIKE